MGYIDDIAENPSNLLATSNVPDAVDAVISGLTMLVEDKNLFEFMQLWRLNYRSISLNANLRLDPEYDGVCSISLADGIRRNATNAD